MMSDDFEGTLWTAVAHIITGVIGSGVLSLAWSMAQLGWIAGPLAMVLFASVTLFATFLLCDCHRSPDPEYGPRRNRSYLEAVDMCLGNNLHKSLLSRSPSFQIFFFCNDSFIWSLMMLYMFDKHKWDYSIL